MASQNQKNTLFVRNLPPAAAKSDLDSHFGGIGPLRHTIVVTEPGSKKCKGFGFVTFAFQEDAQNALKSLDGSCIRGRKITLDVAKKRQRREETDLETAAPRQQWKKEPVKRRGAKKGSLAMRTVLLTTAEKDGQLTEEEARQAIGANNADSGFEGCVMSADSREARCTFLSWSLAGKAAALAHGSKYHAVIEALRGGKRTRLIVRNLPFLIDENELRSRFQSIAPLRELRLSLANVLKVSDNRKGKPTDSAVEEEAKQTDIEKRNEQGSLTRSATVRCGGYAFVEYFLVADAKFAIAKLNGIKIGGRVIAVDHAIGRSAYEAQEQDEEGDAGSDAGEIENKKQMDHVNEDTDADESDAADQQTEDIPLEPSQKGMTEGKKAVSEGDSTKPSKKAAASTEEELSRTVFVRNLLFETSASELWKAMEEEFGKVEQAVLVIHPATKRPRGTAFVRFAAESSAGYAVERAGDGDTTNQESRNDTGCTETPKTSGLSLQGRPLMISKAVDRSTAKEFEGGSTKRQDGDPRNLRLAWIGMVKADSPEGKGLSREDLARHAKAEKEKKAKLERNPNVFVSDVRLCIRNLPKEFDEKLLKQMFLCAAQEKPSPKSEKKRTVTGVEGDASSRENGKKGKHGPVQPRITHVTIARDPQRNDRSKGYGFVQYEQHEHALRALNFVNNNPKVLEWLIKQRPWALKIDIHRERLMRKLWGDSRRLMVEFALEDRRKVQVIERIKERGRKLSEQHKRKRSEAPDGEASGGKRKRQKQGSPKDSNMRTSKSEKRAALKRKRATTTSKNCEKEVREKKEKRAEETEKAKRQSPRNSELDAGSRPQSRDKGLQDMKAIEQLHPTPKKPRKKRKAVEPAEDKFDGLLLTYKQKLAKTESFMPQQAEGHANDVLDAKPRWFE